MKKTCFALLAVSFAAWTMFAVPSVAAPDVVQPLSVHVELTNNKISLGEPILLKYRITSSVGDSAIEVGMGRDKRGWLKMALTDAAGHPVQALPDQPPLVNGLHSDGVRLDPNGTTEGYEIISQRFRPVSTGRYILNISSHLTYNIGEDTSTSVSSEDYSLVFEVTPRNTQRLSADAEALRQTALKQTNVVKRQAAIVALFSMQEADAAPVWLSLVSEPTLNQSVATEVAQQLVRLNSAVGADLLARMAWNPSPQWTEGGFDARVYLQQMHQAGDMKTKQHVEQLFNSHNEHVPTQSMG